MQLKRYAEVPRAWESAHYFIIEKIMTTLAAYPQLGQDSEVFALFYWEGPDSSHFRPPGPCSVVPDAQPGC